MKRKEILDSIEHVSPELVLEADMYKSSKNRRIWSKWIAVAACLGIVFITGIFSMHYINDKHIPDSADLLKEKGIYVISVDAPQYVTNREMPVYTHSEIVTLINEHPAVVGHITKREDLKIEDKDVTWYFSIITIEVSDVLNGKVEQDNIKIVSGTTSNSSLEDKEFLLSPQVKNISEGQEGLFVLREFDENATWTIGTEIVDAQELGDYLICLYLEKNDDAFWLQGEKINFEELKP